MLPSLRAVGPQPRRSRKLPPAAVVLLRIPLLLASQYPEGALRGQLSKQSE